MNNGIESIWMELTEPLKWDQTLAFKDIAVFVGANGVGKSFVMKLLFALGNTAVVISKVPKQELWPQIAQEIFDGTFSNNNINGKLRLNYTDGSNVEVSLMMGKVGNVYNHDLVNPIAVTYMSASLRTFEAMGTYLRYRSQLPKDVEPIQGMLLYYPLYDIMYVESLLQRMPLKLTPEQIKVQKSFGFNDEIQKIEVDDNGFYFIGKLGNKIQGRYPMSMLGSGQQAIINMFIGSGM